METIKDIAVIIGCILSVISLICIFKKSGCSLIKSIFKKSTLELSEINEKQTEDIEFIKEHVSNIKNDLDIVKESSKQQCRNIIKNIYYRYAKEKVIPLYERKTADYTYKIYNEGFHANSYVKLLYEEICKWEVKPSEKLLEEEEEE